MMLALALGLRELTLARERAIHLTLSQQLHSNLDSTRAQLRRLSEDYYVLTTLLMERHVVGDAELSRGRARLIEQPRRIAQQRDLLQRKGLASAQLVVDEGDGNIH
ncbi:MAG: hypothetical protein EOO59_15440 [Hymenobacter sp.]|nr:MAG: hypothetical protein EOO59_15440 [Hymenobacter sp.]